MGGFVQLITEQLAGYYDPETKTLYIADWVPARHQRMTMAHELAHALQDQHFNLSEILKESKGNDDQALARQAVVEGEALAIMFDHILRPSKRTFLNLPNIMEFYQRLEGKDTPGQKALSSAPEFLRQTLLFPYLYGARFLQVYRKWHPWDDLARVYADLPASTEQIMHPEKYTGRRDHPTLVEAETPPLLVGWNSIYQNVLGEFVTYLVLREYLSERTAKLASKGWDGDSIQLFEHGDGRTGLYLLSVWDSERDSEQFFTAYSSLIPEKYPDVEQVEEPGVGGPQAEWKSHHHRIRVELDGTWVRIVEWELPRGNEAT